MKNAAFSIFKKELARFFGDKRLVFTTIIMPGLMIYIMYSLMGTAMDSFINVESDYVYQVEAVNMPNSISKLFPSDIFSITDINQDTIEDSKQELRDEKLDLCIVFPDNIEQAITEFSPGKNAEEIPNIEIYYNSVKTKSSTAYDMATQLLNQMETGISNVFDINENADSISYDVATKEETSGMIMASILPMILLIFMYSSCVALAPESIAGDKERGTIATLLITPIKRSQIAIGKILALALLALLGGISSFLGTFLSIPNMMGGVGEDIISTQAYTATDYVWLILLILSTILLFITAISVISAMAKTVKEASTSVLPLMIIVMAVSFMSMYSTAAKVEAYWYMIPVYSAVQSMIGIFSFTASPVNMTIAIVSNIIYSLIGVYALAKMFNSEKIIFSK